MEIGILEKVLAEKVSYHSRPYFSYYKPQDDDANEDENTKGYNDARKVYYDEKAPLVKIKRACGADNNIYENPLPGIFDHKSSTFSVGFLEELSYWKSWFVKSDLKIFHIWRINLNKKPHSLPSLVKFQSKTDEIEFELDRLVKSENWTSETKTKVSFFLDTQYCDRILSSRVDDFEINYSLFSNARRVKIEIRAYNADGSSALNVNGNVNAYLHGHHTNNETVLFEKKNEDGNSEPIATSDTPLVSSVLIIPGGGFYRFLVDMSLNDSAGKFVVKKAVVVMQSRSIAVDEQHYIVGKTGYIILRAFWACLCVEQGSICTCAGGTALGTFKAQYDDDDDDDDDEYEEDEIACNEGSIDYIEDRKKAKISQSHTSICPSPTAVGTFLAESSDSSEGGKYEMLQTSC